jgi:hypothetical protein
VEPESSLPHLQVAATCPYPEPHQPSPSLLHPSSWRCILILSSHQRLGLPIGIYVNSILILSFQPCLFAPELTLLFKVCDEIWQWPADPWHRRLFAGVSPRKPGSVLTSVRVGIVVGKVTGGQVLLLSTFVQPCRYLTANAECPFLSFVTGAVLY